MVEKGNCGDDLSAFLQLNEIMGKIMAKDGKVENFMGLNNL